MLAHGCNATQVAGFVLIAEAMRDADEPGVLRVPAANLARIARATERDIEELRVAGVLAGGDDGLDAPITYRATLKNHRLGEVVEVIPAQPGPLWCCPRLVRSTYVSSLRSRSPNPYSRPRHTPLTVAAYPPYRTRQGPRHTPLTAPDAAPREALARADSEAVFLTESRNTNTNTEGAPTVAPSLTACACEVPHRESVKTEREGDGRDSTELNGKHETSSNLTPGEVCIALKRAGIGRVSPTNLDLVRLCAEGMTLAEFEHAAALAMAAAHVSDRFRYALRVAESERRRMAAAEPLPPMPASGRPRSFADSSRDFYAQLAAMKAEH